ncbi:MAG: hypothetical protein QOG67_252 [Verrucomicrobiota bacterium]
MREFLTQSRKGAKKRNISKHRSFVRHAIGDPLARTAISSLEISGLASLRETSVTPGREEFFTLRREGAKKPSKSKTLSALAPWRDTSGSKSKRRRFLRHAVGDALYPVLDQVLAKIDKKAESFIHQSQVGQYLLAVDRVERGNRFHLDDDAIVDDQVGAKAFVESDPIPYDRNRYLSFHRVSMFAQFMRKRNFVYDFEDAWPESAVQAVGSVNDQSRDFILFHAAKSALQVPACEVKNLRALMSLRETSDSETVLRKGAKAQREERIKTRGCLGMTTRVAFSFSNLGALASLRETSVTPGREEFFTLRREGAKEGTKQNTVGVLGFTTRAAISFSNLSGLASLRETFRLDRQRK